ncbi:MAG: adenine phosphoribosyltransferase [Phycisphaerae bacterium]|nr:adenine phosphoribosyltransferase [Phycisphaerae bacterium]
MNIESLVRDVPDFPTPGISFKDITPLLSNPAGLARAIEQMANPYRGKGIELVCGAESRGFIFGTAVAQVLSAGFVPIRKPNKLPGETHTIDYGLEYGSDTLEIHVDAIRPAQRVLVVDDLLATGGTLKACCDLIERLGGHIAGVSVLIELVELQGRNQIKPYDNVRSVIRI